MNAFLPPLSLLKIGCMVMVFLSTKVADGDEKWACGNNAIVEDATLMIAAKLCSATTALVGECCEGHDECYRIMSNTKRCCDSVFCSCLRKSAMREPWYRYLPCLAFAELACVTVKYSGPDVFKPYKAVPPTCGWKQLHEEII
ncbi:hypothetical protein Tcan_01745 [Toxocara canis]|uniref:Uncharacterized protein n=1 Tax=Toxocara canis TaxID=6265 RepID=A0A0B2UT99_TOXCA|nr:hypothetical protein Tcan_01745 [Toxocara canis]